VKTSIGSVIARQRKRERERKESDLYIVIVEKIDHTAEKTKTFLDRLNLITCVTN